ncbi:GNAT family protein [Streptomyces sp. AK02-01A]|uniref:GNAT family N-acetyltransferase n=1 Tax=Streptomyces sp. AK02-01A TaxID=3028648 RepID=UPI0029B85056|nr:GNAT family protein [Streptomyces sp. AK02-01A]MDX3851787.1 GNAT family protein [Streptomyces sp. AK02-01A]
MSDFSGTRLPDPADVLGFGLRLRAWREGDESALLRGLSDAEFKRWNAPLVDVSTEAEAALQIKQRAEGWRKGTMAHFCITEDTGDGTEGPVLGSVGLGLLDLRLRTGRVGYWVLPEARGRGVAGRALELCSRWAFEEAGLHRIELGHALTHSASCRIAERCGYRYEGTLRGAMFEAVSRDAFRDAHLHARLAADPWPVQDPPAVADRAEHS